MPPKQIPLFQKAPNLLAAPKGDRAFCAKAPDDEIAALKEVRRGRRHPRSPESGRPPLGPEKLRHLQVLVRFTKLEHEHARATARHAGMTLQDLIRALVLGKRILPRPPEIHSQCIDLLRALSNDLQQAFLVLHRGGGSADLRSAVRELLQLSREIRTGLLRGGERCR